MMTQLVKDLQLPAQKEKDTLGLLTKWQLTGYKRESNYFIIALVHILKRNGNMLIWFLSNICSTEQNFKHDARPLFATIYQFYDFSRVRFKFKHL